MGAHSIIAAIRLGKNKDATQGTIINKSGRKST